MFVKVDGASYAVEIDYPLGILPFIKRYPHLQKCLFKECNLDEVMRDSLITFMVYYLCGTVYAHRKDFGVPIYAGRWTEF